MWIFGFDSPPFSMRNFSISGIQAPRCPGWGSTGTSKALQPTAVSLDFGAHSMGAKNEMSKILLEEKRHEFKKTALKTQAKKTRGLLYNQSQKGMNVCCSYPPFILEQKATARLRIYRTNTNGYRHSWTLHDVRDCILVALLEVSAKLWYPLKVSCPKEYSIENSQFAHEWSKSWGATSEQCSRPSAVPENTLLFMDDFPVCGWWSNDNPQRLSLSIVLPVIIHQGFWTDHTQLSPVSDETILDQII